MLFTCYTGFYWQSHLFQWTHMCMHYETHFGPQWNDVPANATSACKPASQPVGGSSETLQDEPCPFLHWHMAPCQPTVICEPLTCGHCRWWHIQNSLRVMDGPQCATDKVSGHTASILITDPTFSCHLVIPEGFGCNYKRYQVINFIVLFQSSLTVPNAMCASICSKPRAIGFLNARIHSWAALISLAPRKC